jgi:hypothetical protein
MIRTIISISEEDKAWLEETAAEEGVPMTEVVRRALRMLRAKTERDEPPTAQLLERTCGLWKGEDGLAYQRRLRDEW